MIVADWATIEQIFNRAVKLSGGRKIAFINRKCVDYPGLLDEINSLLLADSTSGEFFDAACLSFIRKALAYKVPKPSEFSP